MLAETAQIAADLSGMKGLYLSRLKSDVEQAGNALTGRGRPSRAAESGMSWCCS